MANQKCVDGVMVDMTAEEITARQAVEKEFNDGAFDRAMAKFRYKRNELLTETDYFGASDQTMSSDMTAYRKDLRDLTNGIDTVDKINNVTWPTKP